MNDQEDLFDCKNENTVLKAELASTSSKTPSIVFNVNTSSTDDSFMQLKEKKLPLTKEMNMSQEEEK